jgi:DNA-nicking Smr family endonuclease
MLNRLKINNNIHKLSSFLIPLSSLSIPSYQALSSLHYRTFHSSSLLLKNRSSSPRPKSSKSSSPKSTSSNNPQSFSRPSSPSSPFKLPPGLNTQTLIDLYKKLVTFSFFYNRGRALINSFRSPNSRYRSNSRRDYSPRINPFLVFLLGVLFTIFIYTAFLEYINQYSPQSPQTSQSSQSSNSEQSAHHSQSSDSKSPPPYISKDFIGFLTFLAHVFNLTHTDSPQLTVQDSHQTKTNTTLSNIDFTQSPLSILKDIMGACFSATPERSSSAPPNSSARTARQEPQNNNFTNIQTAADPSAPKPATHGGNHKEFPAPNTAGDAKRKEARIHAENRARLFNESQKAFNSGDKAGAKRLSDEAKAEGSHMDRCNQEAANIYFNGNNRDRGLGLDTIDLHGLFVEEAIERVERRLKEARAAKLTRLVVITGRGNHSPDHIPKIKPALEKLVRQERLHVALEQPNPGCFTVLLDSKETGFIHPTGSNKKSNECNVQ